MPRPALLTVQEELGLRLRLKARRAEARPADYSGDPVGYARDVLRLTWSPGIVAVAESVRTNRRTLVQASHSVGKTHGAAGLIQWWFDSFPASIALTTAPNWQSTRDLLWAELGKQRRHSVMGQTGLTSYDRGVPMMLNGGDMHYARGHNAETGEGFQGRHAERILIVLDEAPGVPVHIWTATESMLQAPEARVLALGNPTVTSGPYYDAQRDPAWHVIRLSALDHPNIAAELAGLPPSFPAAVRLVWVEEMLANHCERQDGPTEADYFEFPPGSGDWWSPDDEFRPRVLGLSPRQASNAVWSEAMVETARTNVLEWSGRDRPEIGCDVARFGDDKTTIYGRIGPCVLRVRRHSKRDTQETAGACIEMAKELADQFRLPATSIPIKVDDDGVGGGTTDAIRAARYLVVPINAGSTAYEPSRYPNRRSELWFSSRDRAQKRELDLTRLSRADYDALKKDLLAPTYSLNGRGQRVVEAKKDIKARIGRSPDDGDGFNLAFSVTPLPFGWMS